MGYRILTKNI